MHRSITGEVRTQPRTTTALQTGRGSSEAEEEGSARGAQGRPSDYGHSVGVRAQRPNEPGGGPRRTELHTGFNSQGQSEGRGVHLVPSDMWWQNVQQVQQHMARAREEQRSRRQ